MDNTQESGARDLLAEILAPEPPADEGGGAADVPQSGSAGDAPDAANGARGAAAAPSELDEFVRAYPDVFELPAEVLAAVAAGRGLLEAYRAYENEGLKQQLRAREQEARNAATSTGPAAGAGAGDPELDALLAVFDSVFK